MGMVPAVSMIGIGEGAEKIDPRAGESERDAHDARDDQRDDDVRRSYRRDLPRDRPSPR